MPKLDVSDKTKTQKPIDGTLDDEKILKIPIYKTTNGGIMPKYKATEKFKELGIENSYHHIDANNYFKLREGKIVELKLKKTNQYLITGKYIEKVK